MSATCQNVEQERARLTSDTSSDWSTVGLHSTRYIAADKMWASVNRRLLDGLSIMSRLCIIKEQ